MVNSMKVCRIQRDSCLATGEGESPTGAHIRSRRDRTFRICPGKHFADASLFINMATVLHAFDIGPPKDENGNAIHIEPKMTNGIMS